MTGSPVPTRPTLVAVSLGLAVIAALLLSGMDVSDPAGRWSGGTSELLVPQPVADVTAAQPDRWPEGWSIERRTDPDRSVVVDAVGAEVATFTDGASTVVLVGPERRFDEPTAEHGVTTDRWVRVLPEPFDGEVDAAWLAAAPYTDLPDVLEVLTRYWTGAPDEVGNDGVLISAEAGYGPLQADGSRAVGADWHDFRGVEAGSWGRSHRADEANERSLDCSGYVREVYGVRFGLPLTRRPDGGASLPRRAKHQAAIAPGIMPIGDTGEPLDPARLEHLQAGDLVFFDAPSDDDRAIDHVGVYLGVDHGGHHRFVHSRTSVDGPTMGGDQHGRSVVDGDGFFARGFRATRRL
jgi:cell wall-associated NlpC family hydrolase